MCGPPYRIKGILIPLLIEDDRGQRCDKCCVLEHLLYDQLCAKQCEC